MKRLWMGAALLALAALPQAGWGQSGTIPSPVGPARIPEPCPDYVAPNLVPGPLRPEIAPAGPPSSLDLPANHSSAFQEVDYPLDEGCYFHIGYQMLARAGWGNLPLFYRDPVTNLDTGTVPNRLTPIGIVLDVNQLDRPTLNGVRGTLGCLFNGHYAVEVTGFHMFEEQVQTAVGIRGRLNSFFNNVPLGFEGNNGMWLQADRAQISRAVKMTNGELNYRYTSGAVIEPELILGVRYFELQDQFNIYTGDDDDTFLNSQFLPDRRRQASLDYITRNRLVAPQAGFEWTPIQTTALFFGVNAKGAWGPNFAEIDTRLVRGDGRVGYDGGSTKVVFSQLYEFNAFCDLIVLDRFRVRAAYQAMWLLSMADSHRQVSFDLRDTNGKRDTDGSQFWHGPSIEMQFFF